MAVAAAVIGARLYLHVVIQRRPPTLSDYFMCCAWLLSFASSTFDVYFAVTGSLDTNDDNDQEATVENIEYRQEVSLGSFAVKARLSQLWDNGS
jgi:hypothetical protein